MSEAPRRNRLADEKSPYLLQHAGNPVDWYPWSEEAIARARREDRPIFLSVGYSTCHWCHVMERESFENPEIAEAMNRHFVCIKVDREERPDIDRVAMLFVQATTGSGGWPTSVWLTPELEPFAGGTYFPPRARMGRPGFLEVLGRIAELWEKERPRVRAEGARILAVLGEHAAARAEPGPVPPDLAARALREFEDVFDAEHGGFGGAPKFPRPAALRFLAGQALARGPESAEGKSALRMLGFTLRCMADGGMNDQLGGGFHRYSVDRVWHVPHFEKMLYDQAQLAAVYVDAWRATGDPRHAETARGTLDYVLRDLADPMGGFHCAEDADSLPRPDAPEKLEGAFYVWTREEIARLLPGEAGEWFCRAYGVEARGNVPPEHDPSGELQGMNILNRRFDAGELAGPLGRDAGEVAAALETARATLFEARALRPRPHRDDKVLSGWNGLAISALARAGRYLGEARYLDAASGAAEFLARQLWREQGEEDGVLLRLWRDGAADVPGFAEDYAFLIEGLLDLYEATFDWRWLRWAAGLQSAMDRLFSDPAGGYFSSADPETGMRLPLRDDQDGAEPSANSVAVGNLARLSAMLGDEGLRARAEAILRAFSAQLSRAPTSLPHMIAAAEWMRGEPAVVVLAGAPDDPRVRALRAAADGCPGKSVVLLVADGGAGQEWLARRLPHLRDLRPAGDIPAAYLCEGRTCRPPVTDPAELRELLSAR